MTDKSPQRRLLEAMVTINAINNGRPVPDMDEIEGGWVVRVEPGQSREELASRLIGAIKADGVTVRSGDTSNDPNQDNAKK